MQLLIIQDYLRAGGTEKQSVYVANSLYALGTSVGCMTFRPGGIERALLHIPGHAIQILQPFDSRLNGWSPGLIRRVRALRPQAILLMGYVANEKGAQLKRALPDSSVIASVRTSRHLSCAYLQGLTDADSIVVNSRWALNILVAKHEIQREKIIHIDNPLTRHWDEPALSTQRAVERQRLNVADCDCMLINVAGFRRNKRQCALIEQFQALSMGPRWKLFFVGDGPELSKCRRRVQQLQMEDRIAFLGYQADPGNTLAAADIIVSASQRDAQPNALIEAQAMGLPVVAFDFAGIGECFLDGKTGFLVQPGDTDTFLHKIQLLAEDKSLRHAYGRAAKDWANAKFNSKNIIEKYINLIYM